jgi:ElaB/YqjD/DUF883 family membrane-anchored ribosome-binding protein
MSTSNQGSNDAREQIAHLREQVDALMRDRVAPAVSDIAGRAQHYMDDASQAARGQTEALSARVREAPLVSLLAAAGIGYLVGRIFR